MIEAAAQYGHTLLLRAASGDSGAARELLDQTASIVYGFVFARVGGRQDIAEDLTQATYIDAFRSAAGFRGEAAIETWLCAIARRQVAAYFKSERRRFRLEHKLRLVAVDTATDEDAIEGDRFDDDAMIAGLGRLIPPYRQVLVLKYLDEMSVEAIAGELGRSKVQVQSILQRARAAFKRELEAGTDE